MLPKSTPDININFDLKANYPIEAVSIVFVYSTVEQIRIGLHEDDCYTGQQPDKEGKFYLPDQKDVAWKWYNGTALQRFPTLAARYVQIQLRGGSGSGGFMYNNWAINKIRFLGSIDAASSCQNVCSKPLLTNDCLEPIGCIDGLLCSDGFCVVSYALTLYD
jgi:hypothetical protein